jgi:hypothetical protein
MPVNSESTSVSDKQLTRKPFVAQENESIVAPEIFYTIEKNCAFRLEKLMYKFDIYLYIEC